MNSSREKKKISILPLVTNAAKKKLKTEISETTELYVAENGEICLKAYSDINHSEKQKHHNRRKKN